MDERVASNADFIWRAMIIVICAALIALGIVLLAYATMVAYPDLTLTPGAIRPDATVAQLCAKGFTTRKYRRTTAAMKAHVYAEYHRAKKSGVCCEVDHLVPLELGGQDDVKNLWPQPYQPTPAAHQKDLVENCLHKLVCTGKVSLSDAQHRLIIDWAAEYVREGRGRTCK